jgi:hypothetical protein
MERKPVRGRVDDHLEHVSGDQNDRVALVDSDRSVAGRFRDDRDAVMHLGANVVAVVIWIDGAMKVRHHQRDYIDGRWNISANDRVITGDFHASDMTSPTPQTTM